MRNIVSPLDGFASPFGGRRQFSPLSLDPVAFYDPSDTSTLFQDAAGTTPVASAGDPVRLMLDKSGNGNHLTAPSDAARPVYQTDGTYHWLEFDGVDDELATAAPLPFSATAFNCVSFRLDAYNAPFPNIIVHRGNGTGVTARHPLIYMNQSSTSTLAVNWGENVGADQGFAVNGIDLVVSSYVDGTARQQNVNGNVITRTGGTLSDGGTDPFKISGGNRFDGRFYGTVQVNAVPTDSQIAATRAYFARKSGGIA